MSPMASMTDVKDKQRKLIATVLDESVRAYKECGSERRHISQSMAASPLDPLGNVEVFADAVAGFACTIAKSRSLSPGQVKQLDLLGAKANIRIEAIFVVLEREYENYRKYRYYVQLVDYLRGLCLEYVNDVESHPN